MMDAIIEMGPVAGVVARDPQKETKHLTVTTSASPAAVAPGKRVSLAVDVAPKETLTAAAAASRAPPTIAGASHFLRNDGGAVLKVILLTTLRTIGSATGYG